MYFFHLVAGVVALIYPVEVVRGEVGENVVTAWAVAMILAAFVCLAGAITDRWIGEYTALPLLIGVLFVYGGAGLAGASRYGFPSFVFGIIVCSFGFGLASRWMDVRDVKRADTTRHPSSRR
jgi:hypothetical protein